MADLTFPIPEGFQPPENLDSDDTFQAMGTFKVVGENELQLIDVEGYQVGDEDTEGDTQAAAQADQANAASALQGAQGASNGSAGQALPNQSQDQTPPGTPPDRVGAFAEAMGQKFRKATGRR
jgi:hypothetical protein